MAIRHQRDSTSDTDGQVYMYFDGVRVRGPLTKPFPPDVARARMIIGTGGPSPSSNMFVGQMKEIFIWDVELTT